ncbi:UNVERIFIED_CONTAM: hypothetical protein FKN15_046599 [Acipenser sinensis]
MTYSVPFDAVGRQIICDGEKGTLLFIGNVPPTAGLWLGVEWDNPERCKHDGSNEGIQYFKSSHPTSASFICPKKANFGVDFLTVVKRRYELEDNQDNTEKMTVGKAEVQMVGFQSVSEKQSGNRLSILANPSSLTHAFANLKELALNKTGVNWSEILPDERRGAELDYCKIFGKEWLEVGGHQDREKNRPSEAFTAQHPRYQILIEKYGASEDGELTEQQPSALKNQLLTHRYHPCADSGEAKMNTRCPPKRVPSAARFFTLCRLTVQPPQSYSVGGQRSSGQLTGKPAGARPDYRGRWCAMEGKEIEIDNDLKPLQFYSIEDGDSVLVQWS